MMRSPANQRRRTRNRRNRRQPPNQRTAPFQPKLKYQNSFVSDNVFFLSKRKVLCSPEDLEQQRLQKKRRKLDVKEKQLDIAVWRHKVLGLWQYGCFLPDCQFGPGNSKRIIQFLQQAKVKFAKEAAARTFLYDPLKRHRNAGQAPHLDPFRDRRGENRNCTKRKNPAIVQLCEELFSEPKMTARKIKNALQTRGHRVSRSTIYRIAQDLSFGWTKPWYTDVLTSAQKLKRFIFCGQLLRLSEQELFEKISRWCYTDEKWWDIVGPALSQWTKGASKMERKMQNQVCMHVCWPTCA